MLYLLYNCVINVIAFVFCQILIAIIFSVHSMSRFFISKNNPKARYYYNFFFYYFFIFLTSLFFIPVFILRPRNPKNNHLFSPVFEYISSNFIGIEQEIRNAKILTQERAAIVINNHQSMLDISTSTQLIRPLIKELVYVCKKEHLYLLPFGTMHWLMGSIFVTRKSRKNAVEILSGVAKNIKERKTKILIYPEGTRNNNRETLLPFRKGAFNLAVMAQVPIIPIVTSPYYFLDHNKPSFTKPRIIMEVLDEISTVGLTEEDVPRLTEEVYANMMQVYQKLYKEVMTSHARVHNDEYSFPGSLTIRP